MSRPREKRETGEQDLFRSRLDQIINMEHELVRLAQAIDWPVLEERFGAVYSDGPGMPPLPTRLMAGLAILKHTFNLSDEVLCERWVENLDVGGGGIVLGVQRVELLVEPMIGRDPRIERAADRLDRSSLHVGQQSKMPPVST